MIKSMVLATTLALASLSAQAQAAEEFYKGKQITLIIGSGAGGGYDLYARALARHIGKHIPGNPQIVPKNLSTAGGVVAANALYSQVDRDGLTFGALTTGNLVDPLFGNPKATYDALKFNWLGSLGKLEKICGTWYTNPVKTIEQLRTTQVLVGGTGATSDSAVFPKVMNALVGTKLKIVQGYEPGPSLELSVEKGETEGICGISWSTLKASHPDWVQHNKLNVIIQMGLSRLPDLPDVPSAMDLVANEEDRQVLELILIPQEMGRPFVAPPGVPAERLAILRRAFEATWNDPDYLAEAKRLQMEIEPMTGADMQALLERAYGRPQNIISRATALILPPNINPK
jgi:tripartite-type tricarboxylate transporter receptor subunit TctC